MPSAVLLMFALFGWVYYPVMRVQYRETRERERLAAELQAVKERNARLRAQVERLKTPAGVEDYARSQLGLVKKGENVVVVVDDQKKAPATEVDAVPTIDSAQPAEAARGPWTAFLDLVFGVE